MSNEIKIFENEEFGQVRTVLINEEPWFVGKDVCEIFGDTNYRRSLSNIDGVDKSLSQIVTRGGKQNMIVVNESGLYSLLFQMQPQKAKGVSQNEPLAVKRIEKIQKFKHWVTSEVLPSIRKNGGYIANQEDLTEKELLAKALLVANNIIDEKNKKLEYQNNKLIEQKPKVEYFDDLVDNEHCTNIRDTAKELGYRQNDFINILLNGKYIYRDINEELKPYAKYVNRGYFVLKDFISKSRHTGVQTLITVDGKNFLRKQLRKEVTTV